MTEFINYMSNQFYYIYTMLSNSRIAEYFNGATVALLLIMFYIVWQIIYMLVVRPVSLPGAPELVIAHQNNVRAHEEKVAREIKAYREKRGVKYTVKYGKGGTQSVSSRYTQYDDKGNSITHINPNSKAPDNFVEFE